MTEWRGKYREVYMGYSGGGKEIPCCWILAREQEEGLAMVDHVMHEELLGIHVNTQYTKKISSFSSSLAKS